MELNWKILLIGGAAIVLLVAFGNNPVENARKAKKEAMKGKDPVLESIREHSEKNARRQPAASQPRNSRPAYPQQPARTGYFGSGATGNAGAPDMPDYMYSGGQPRGGVQPPPAPASTGGYYPPPAPTPPAPRPAAR